MRISFAFSILVSILILFFALLISEGKFADKFYTFLNKLGFSDNLQVISQVSDIKESDHINGEINSNIVLIEYSDYTCLICASMRSILDQLISEEKMSVVYRHLYTDDNSKGFYFATIAECLAHSVGENSFKEITRYFYNPLDDITKEEADKEAIRLGLTALELERCKSSEKIKKEIIEESQEAKKVGAQGTPFIIITHKGKITGFSYGDTYGSLKERIFNSIEEI